MTDLGQKRLAVPRSTTAVPWTPGHNRAINADDGPANQKTEAKKKERQANAVKTLRIAIALGSVILAGCSGDSNGSDPAAFERQAQTVEKTYGLALSRLVACMIDDDVREPHPRFDLTAKTADFDLRGVFRMHIEANGADETRATVTAIPGGDPMRRLDHYVGVLDRCGSAVPGTPPQRSPAAGGGS